MYTSFLKELRLSLAFHDISKDSLLGRLVPNVLPSDKLLRYMWTSVIYAVMWWIIQSIYRPNDLNLLLIMNDLNLLNCTEIFFHESGYFIVKVSFIQNNLDENNLPFLPFILKRFTLFFQEINNQLIHTAMVNHSNFDIALSISNYLTSLMITTPCWSIHPWWMTNEVTGHPFNTFLNDLIFVIQGLSLKQIDVHWLIAEANLRRSKQGKILAAVLFLYIFLLANHYFYSNFAGPSRFIWW